MTEGWVIMNANMDQYRAWQNGGTVWVKDLADATFYARRVDAEAVHLDDDAAWRVVRKPLPDGGEAVHGQVERDRSRDESKDSLSGPTGEVGGAPEGWVLVPREPSYRLISALASEWGYHIEEAAESYQGFLDVVERIGPEGSDPEAYEADKIADENGEFDASASLPSRSDQGDGGGR